MREASTSDRALRLLGWVVFVVALAAGAAVAFLREYTGDFHWHVVVGSETLARGAVLQEGIRSHTFGGQREIAFGWLGDVFLAAAWQIGGYLGCFALHAVVLVATLLLLDREMRKRGLDRLGSGAVLLAFLAIETYRLHLRPEMFALACFAGLLSCLGEHQRTRRRAPLAIAVVLLMLWANFHGSVAAGLLPWGLYCLEWGLRCLVSSAGAAPSARLRRCSEPALAFAAGLAASCINPEGIGIPLAFRVLTPNWNRVFEWLPLSVAGEGPLFQACALGLLALVVLAGFRVSPWLLLTVAVTGYFAARHQRLIVYALIAAAPLVADAAARVGSRLAVTARARVWSKAGRVVALSLAVASVATLFGVRHIHRYVGLGIDPASYPEQACRFARTEGFDGPLFNSFNLGSYLMYCLEGRPVFIDQRANSLYPDAFYARYREAAESEGSLRRLTDQYGVTWAFVEYDPFATLMSAAPETWRLVYFDDQALIYVRADRQGQAGWADRPGFRYLEPARLAALPDLEEPALGEAFAELSRQEARCPRCTKTLLARAALAAAARDHATFRATVGLVTEAAPREVAYLEVKEAIASGDFEGARAWIRRLARLGVDTRAITGLLAETYRREREAPPAP